ncbi:helix-turn-helix transcriptional regulator [Streptomyces sp. HU2014]|uniref:helix-turn-helix domain-containing protein n=1 Tax=Streptomyces sp. HU2014 TaxID=2939414 RepID=UPI00200DC4E7|nr:helix-turn-helix transcriptional regulator [Streptomyces sp. HU2014]UQI46022.1 helix-turn-helix transcriptional regulator [Streptomyces sp. HU2014]
MKPLPDHRLGRLAGALRQARLRKGMSREQAAALIHVSVSTIQRAEAGRTRPTWPVTHALTDALGADLTEAEILWKRAGGPPRGTTPTQAPRLSLVRNAADLAAALVRAYEEDGRPSLRTMEKRAQRTASQFGRMGRMTAWRVIHRTYLPRSAGQLQAFLTACKIPPHDFWQWTLAFARVQAHEESVKRNRPRSGTSTPDPERLRLTAEAAKADMRRAGLIPLDPYPGAQNPWAAECAKCGSLSRFRFSAVRKGRGCRVCATGQEAA